MASWRQSYEEKDLSAFTTLNVDETGAMVLKSRKGPSTPKRVTADQVLTYFGKPSSEFPAVFDLLSFTKTAPCWAVSAIGSGALYGGVDVLADSVAGFGVGRDFDTYDYSVIARQGTKNVGTGDGYVNYYSGTLANIPVIDTDDLYFTVNGTTVDIDCAVDGTLSGAAITDGAIDLNSGTYQLTFAGTQGTYAEVTSTVDFSSTIDLSGSTKYIGITVDGVSKTVNLGSSATTAKTDVINAINAAYGAIVASSSGNYIKVSGAKASTAGNVSIYAPTIGDSALILVFNAAGTTLSSTGTAPTGSIPLYGQAIVMNYHYSISNTTVSHSIWTISPYTDDLAAVVLSKGGYKFNLSLYQTTDSGGYVLANTYDYSLIRELDGYGTSLYYEDVFDDDMLVQVSLNPNFINTTYNITSTTKVAFSGGYRGADPVDSDYLEAWSNFNYANKYKAKIFMDVIGNSASTINNLIQTYQTWAQGASIVPRGNTASEAITYRSALGIDSDDIALYTNWSKIKDDYNNSFAWISNIGSIGRKYALCYDSYDAASPAGRDENNHGGQISDYTVIEMENEYTDSIGGDLQLLDEAQINPFVKDDVYGLMAYGDRTLQVSNSDTSFIGTRRVYKYLIDQIQRQVLRKQEFKNNDERHRLMARTGCISILDPILGGGWLREYLVVCDSSNNTDAVMNRREFVVDVYVKITPNSQKVRLRLTRMAQGQTVAEVAAA